VADELLAYVRDAEVLNPQRAVRPVLPGTDLARCVAATFSNTAPRSATRAAAPTSPGKRNSLDALCER